MKKEIRLFHEPVSGHTYKLEDGKFHHCFHKEDQEVDWIESSFGHLVPVDQFLDDLLLDGYEEIKAWFPLTNKRGKYSGTV